MKNKIYGLIGFPLGHSFSRKYFNDKFKNENICAEYINFEIEDINSLKGIICNNDISGLNVTIPHKKSVIPLLDEIDNEAEIIGAVNVIKFIRRDNKLILRGYNSDIIGFTNSILPLIKEEHKKALILGTGGVSKAIEYSLNKMGIKTLFVSRTPKPNVITYKQLTKEIMMEYTIIVNASPVGMFPNIDNAPDIPYQHITTHHIIFDTIYNPQETLFMKLATERGAKVKNGLEMLEGQAIAAWNIWNDKH